MYRICSRIRLRLCFRLRRLSRKWPWPGRPTRNPEHQLTPLPSCPLPTACAYTHPPDQIRPLSSALLPAPLPTSAPNVNAAWAGLLVEELCRLGVNMFCEAPGEGRNGQGRGAERRRRAPDPKAQQ